MNGNGLRCSWRDLHFRYGGDIRLVLATGRNVGLLRSDVQFLVTAIMYREIGDNAGRLAGAHGFGRRAGLR